MSDRFGEEREIEVRSEESSKEPFHLGSARPLKRWRRWWRRWKIQVQDVQYVREQHVQVTVCTILQSVQHTVSSLYTVQHCTGRTVT